MNILLFNNQWNFIQRRKPVFKQFIWIDYGLFIYWISNKKNLLIKIKEYLQFKIKK